MFTHKAERGKIIFQHKTHSFRTFYFSLISHVFYTTGKSITNCPGFQVCMGNPCFKLLSNVLVSSLPVSSSVGSWLSLFGDPQDSLGPLAWQRSGSDPAWKGQWTPLVQEESGSECRSQSESWCSWFWGALVHVLQPMSEVCNDMDNRVLMIQVYALPNFGTTH